MKKQILLGVLLLMVALTLGGCRNEAPTSVGEPSGNVREEASAETVNMGKLLLEEEGYELLLAVQEGEDRFLVLENQLCFEGGRELADLSDSTFTLRDKASGQTTTFSLAVFTDLLEESSCLVFEKIVSSERLIIALKIGDGLATTKRYYSFAPSGPHFAELYLVRSWETMEDSGVTEYTAWVVENNYILQARVGEKARSVYQGQSDGVFNDRFFLPEEGKEILKTDSPLIFDPLHETNLMNHQEGLLFMHRGSEISLVWE